MRRVCCLKPAALLMMTVHIMRLVTLTTGCDWNTQFHNTVLLLHALEYLELIIFDSYMHVWQREELGGGGGMKMTTTMIAVMTMMQGTTEDNEWLWCDNDDKQNNNKDNRIKVTDYQYQPMLQRWTGQNRKRKRRRCWSWWGGGGGGGGRGGQSLWWW